MYYLFTVTFICAKAQLDAAARGFADGVQALQQLRVACVLFSSFCPERTDDPPTMDGLLEQVKQSTGMAQWDMEPLLYRAFVVAELDPVAGDPNQVGQVLASGMLNVVSEKIPINVRPSTLEACNEAKIVSCVTHEQ